MRAMREARYAKASPPRRAISELKQAVSIVTAPTQSIVTKRAKPAGSGRRKSYKSGAEKQAAYRARKQAKCQTTSSPH